MSVNIALLAGGNSSEREVALRSATQVYGALDKEKYNVWLVDVQGVIWKYIAPDDKEYVLDKNDFSLTVEDCKICFDYALIMIHGTPGEDGQMQGYLDMMGIPYSSSGGVSSVITFDKASCKRAVRETSINLAKEILIGEGEWIDPRAIAKKLELPLFVKPNASGSSCGVTKVKNVEDIPAAVEKAFEESDEVLIEEFIAGREFACGVLITKEKEYLLPVTEIISKNDFFDYEAKYTAGQSTEITPAHIPDTMLEILHNMSLEAYRACRCKGVARVDFIVTPEGKPYMIEVNTIPGMGEGSIIPQQIVAAGMTMTEFLDLIIEDTLCNQ